jgi:hypothetical protein
VLPIISNAPKASGDAAAPEDPAQDAAAQFEGLLFASALEPLSRSIGMLGDVLTGAVSTAVARGLHDDLYRRLQTQIDAEPKP